MYKLARVVQMRLNSSAAKESDRLGHQDIITVYGLDTIFLNLKRICRQ